MDVRDADGLNDIVKAVKPSVVAHLAGQVAMTTSMADPLLDFGVNAAGTLNVLEAVRHHAPDAGVMYSSTNKVYGDLEWVRYSSTETRYVADQDPQGFNESVPLDFSSPYGCSKGSADQYILDYARVFDLKTIVFRHSSMYGGRQFSTADQGWIGWFCSMAMKQSSGAMTEPFTICGSGKQVRDVLHAQDMVSLYKAGAKNIEQCAGEVFNIGGGMDNSFSLLELFQFLEGELGSQLRFEHLPARVSDQRVFVADVRRARELLDWQPSVSREDGVRNMLKWLQHSGQG